MTSQHLFWNHALGLRTPELDRGIAGAFRPETLGAAQQEGGGQGRFDHVMIADKHGVRHESTPTFYDRFEDAFLREDTEFVQTVLEDRVVPLTLRDATADRGRLRAALAPKLLEIPAPVVELPEPPATPA